ncbi:hypothetical protein FEM03_07125 [Phragmitibacter flavus]|uniref:Uncharacterized protein n=1 Tax=Phragmitibacter flavus TaxID=2576071 RepID=A0A5R8KH42_9BACT|nr:hypothetical protein [Phragmitibacter flavus]TLD71295.1 hypothetical protein FEM03_07125 [Phragmitibacter flavus]
MQRSILFFILVLGPAFAVAEDGFAPPDAHPLKHFQEIWKKNPFTLKTAPVAVQKESFAKDLVLGSMVQFGEEIVAVVVNTKTRERTELVSGQNAANGMKIKTASLEDTRKDSFVEVEVNGESAVLHYDENFLKQLATSPGSPVSGGSSKSIAASTRTSSSDDESLRSRRRRETTPTSTR